MESWCLAVLLLVCLVPPRCFLPTLLLTLFRYSEPQQKPFDPFTQQVSQPQPHPRAICHQALPQPTATTPRQRIPLLYAVVTLLRLLCLLRPVPGCPQLVPAPELGLASLVLSSAQIPTTQPPNRYVPVDATNSGHNTPNPTGPMSLSRPSLLSICLAKVRSSTPMATNTLNYHQPPLRFLHEPDGSAAATVAVRWR